MWVHQRGTDQSRTHTHTRLYTQSGRPGQGWPWDALQAGWEHTDNTQSLCTQTEGWGRREKKKEEVWGDEIIIWYETSPSEPLFCFHTLLPLTTTSPLQKLSTMKSLSLHLALLFPPVFCFFSPSLLIFLLSFLHLVHCSSPLLCFLFPTSPVYASSLNSSNFLLPLPPFSPHLHQVSPLSCSLLFSLTLSWFLLSGWFSPPMNEVSVYVRVCVSCLLLRSAQSQHHLTSDIFGWEEDKNTHTQTYAGTSLCQNTEYLSLITHTHTHTQTLTERD